MISIAIRRTLALTAIVCGTVCVGVPASAQDTAAIPIGRDADPQASLPTIIPAQDAALYRRIFELQQDGKWRQADKLIKQIGDRLLMGHVLYQRYMHPTKYRSRYVELKAWLKEYADHPGARRTYALAMRRKPHNWRAPQRPLGVSFGPLPSPVQENAETGRTGKKKYGTRAQRRHARYVTRQVKSLVRRGRPTRALERLQQRDIKRRFHAVGYDRALAIVARGYYHAELDEKALRTAAPAIKRSGAKAPMALWWSGLAAWRSGDYARSAQNFEMLSAAALEDDWIESAAAFWAARAYLAARQPARVNPLLAKAAQKPRTFYGLLAARALGEIPVFEWELPKLGTVEMSLLSQAPAAKRALALIQVGETTRAESELKRFTGSLSPELARILLGLTAKANLPALAYRLGRLLERKSGYHYDAALYPMPDWVPKDGYKVDRAMIFALIRQESGFKPKAKSKAGARGLMQLMPRTAGFMAGKRFRGHRRHALFNPEYNIELGQSYVQHLLAFPGIEGNLFYTTVAYNGGPGNLNKWRRTSEYQDDPLLFIESVPSRETRAFVERVLTNLWIYRYRLGQPTPSLDAIAAGTWPRYNRLDPNSKKVAVRAN
ncbi:MAG: transglycosylase [Rhodospirillaceae bacterium]|nr:transglycosylase [Rhodospirillaceae bacterium]